MKKLLFILNKGNTYGGVWNVNTLLAEGFLKEGYDVHFLAIRDYDKKIAPKHNKKIHYTVINPSKKWEITRGSSIIKEVKSLHFIKSLKTFISYLRDKRELKTDFKKCQQEIMSINPDYIMACHYEQLYAIPDSFLKKTIHLQHSPFSYVMEIKNNYKVLYKYQNRVGKLVWLSKKTCEEALASHLGNSTFIYNAVRFSSDKKADVVKNKKIVTIARFAEVKRIDLMVKIVDEVLKNNPDWVCELYGSGDLKDETLNIINSNKRITLKGVTDNPKKVYLSSSINLNTSRSEGLSLSILEANECGVPTVTFNTGESVSEEVIDNKSGLIIKQDDVSDYILKLSELMNDNDLLKKFSNASKQYSAKFQLDTIIKEWIDLFAMIDNKK